MEAAFRLVSLSQEHSFEYKRFKMKLRDFDNGPRTDKPEGCSMVKYYLTGCYYLLGRLFLFVYPRKRFEAQRV